jgi:hypothetical protein
MWGIVIVERALRNEFAQHCSLLWQHGGGECEGDSTTEFPLHLFALWQHRENGGGESSSKGATVTTELLWQHRGEVVETTLVCVGRGRKTEAPRGRNTLGHPKRVVSCNKTVCR